MSASSSNPAANNRARFIRAQLPAGGLFANQDWRIGPDPFPLGAELVGQLESLGRVLLQFNRAVNLLYHQSVTGKAPPWVAHWLELGKSAQIVNLQRAPGLRNDLPRVIRPDLLLTDHGLAITELDAVPGGIGLTAWLNRTYTEAGAQVIGGPRGMLDGFAGIFGEAPAVHLVVSEESATYRPEMVWIADELNRSAPRFAVRDGRSCPWNERDAVYRFFELFDVANVPVANALFEAAADKRIRLTSPPKFVFEEKLLFALLWNRNLRDFWRRELGDAFFERLRKLVPYSWILDPAPLPPHAAIPELNLTDWRQLGSLSQRERQLILKISGYSDTAWGARSVRLGSDLSNADWAAAIADALDRFAQSPHVLQRYAKPKVIPAAWFDFSAGALVPMNARVRLCPYYFVHGDGDRARAHLGGVLATLCPADKKIIHGMRDAVLLPCGV